ncbi:hypothetical protein AVEN_117970-1 [Araneus ventricosus]|uniref:Insulin-like domain-containing protein n=1 Tax=Araneus ventricosus TaxID=182803 RepID=A0A4Y2H4N8_ARAVE|nr:hypothetical protein AVEN_117970-1 [Araneus ventricosus]
MFTIGHAAPCDDLGKDNVAIVLLLLVSLGSCTEQRIIVRACGRSLSELLSWVCQGNYNSPKNSRRSSFAPMENNGGLFDDDTFKMEEDFFYRQMRAQRGVADECCHRPCSFNTLRSYCGSGDR